MDVSIERIAGQLRYLLEDSPELRTATPEQLAARLNHDDRFARTRERYPLLSDAEIAEKVAETDDRITPEHVRQALDRLR